MPLAPPVITATAPSKFFNAISVRLLSKKYQAIYVKYITRVAELATLPGRRLMNWPVRPLDFLILSIV
jgi:hypothetical protein